MPSAALFKCLDVLKCKVKMAENLHSWSSVQRQFYILFGTSVPVQIFHDDDDDDNNNEKSAQREANTARWL